MASETSHPLSNETTVGVSPQERVVLLVSVLIISICALTYELIVGTMSSYLLGDSVSQFSFTIGLFLAGMGLGALLSRRITGAELRWFIIVELLAGLLGGLSAAILYAVFSATEAYYYPIMVTLVLAIGTCIGLEIPLLTRIVASRTELSKALADVLSIDYLGALIASLAFPVFLLPLLGVTQTAFLMGLFNVLVAALNLRLFRTRLSAMWVRRLWIAIAVLTVVMASGTIFSTDIVRLLEQRLYQDHIIYRMQSSYQRIIMTRRANDLRLYLNGNLQFSSRDEYRYHEMIVHPVMSAARSHATVLILGGGDGMVVRELLQYKDVQKIILVDLDPVMTDLARTYPTLRQLNRDSLSDPRVSIINQDAYKYIEQSKERYPVIIIDLPDPNDEGLSKLYSQYFYRILREHLSPGGAFITQATSPYFVRKAYWSIAHTIQASGFFVLPLRTYVPSFGDWGFIIGCADQPPRVSVPAGLTLRHLTPDVLLAAQIFDPDTAEEPTDINTLDKPVLLRYYDQGWRQWN